MNNPKSPDDPVPKAATTPKKPAAAEKAAQVSEHIGKELRAMFDDVVAEPVPDRFRQLLDELEKKSTD
jgi:hypothetical protein